MRISELKILVDTLVDLSNENARVLIVEPGRDGYKDTHHKARARLKYIGSQHDREMILEISDDWE